MYELQDLVGRQVIDVAERLRGTDPDGWTRLRLRLDWSLDEAPGRLLGMGRDLEVIGPPEVRARVLDLARGVLERHPVAWTSRSRSSAITRSISMENTALSSSVGYADILALVHDRTSHE